MVGSKLDFSRRKEAHRMAVGLMDIKGQYAELQDRIEAAVLEVLRSGRVILGPNVKGFEEDAAAYMGTAGAVGDADGAGGAHVGGGVLFEALDVRAEDDAPAAQHSEHGRFDAVLQLGVLPLDVHESDGHAMRLLAA